MTTCGNAHRICLHYRIKAGAARETEPRDLAEAGQNVHIETEPRDRAEAGAVVKIG